MEKIRLGKDLELSRIVQGFWRLDDWNMTAKELAAFMNACIERGVTSFDTAEIYADTMCEQAMGEALKNDPAIRKKVELVSKTGIFKVKKEDDVFGYYNTTKERILLSCKESLKRLGTDYLDLYLIHREDPCIDFYETADALLTLKKEGLVREIGVSNFDPWKFNGLDQATGGALVTNQIEWNPVCFEHFRSGMMDLLGVKKIHPMIWSPLAGGRLFTEKDEPYASAMKTIREIAARHDVNPAVIVYAWILYHPVKALPINGSNKLSRLDLAIQALDIKLAHHEWYEIYAASGQQIIR